MAETQSGSRSGGGSQSDGERSRGSNSDSSSGSSESIGPRSDGGGGGGGSGNSGKTLTPLFLAQVKEVFGLFDRAGTGMVHVEDMGSMLRALQFNPTEAEVGELMASIDVESVSFAELLTIISSLEADPELDQLLRAFAVFDKAGDGYIDVENLKYILTKSAEPLLDDEVDILLDGVEKVDGRVNYAKFAARILD